MRSVKRTSGWVLLVLAMALLAACGNRPDGEPTPEATAQLTPVPVETQVATDTPAAQPTATALVEATAVEPSTVVPTAIPVSDADVDAGLDLVREFLALLANGDYREAYGSYLSTAGQEQLADLILGRLALPNPHISFFELVGAEAVDGQIVVDVNWQETYDGQGLVGTQQAQVILDRADGVFLVDDMVLAEYQPAATPVPPPLPRAEAIVNPAVPGEEMTFRAAGFEAGETVLAWLELPDGTLVNPSLQPSDDEGTVELVYAGQQTTDLAPGRWIWWAQALRDSARNTGITFEVLPPPTPTVTPTPRPQPTNTPRPTTVAAAPAPTDTPEPSGGYPAPILLWPEPETSREYPGALVVEFVPVTGQLAPEEFYELVLVARDGAGNIYNGGSVRGKGDGCETQYAQECVSLTADGRFMRLFYPSGFEGQGTWYVQVVRQTAPEQFTPISPASEERRVLLKPR